MFALCSVVPLTVKLTDEILVVKIAICYSPLTKYKSPSLPKESSGSVYPT
jgi:hypothetical protein